MRVCVRMGAHVDTCARGSVCVYVPLSEWEAEKISETPARSGLLPRRAALKRGLRPCNELRASNKPFPAHDVVPGENGCPGKGHARS